CSDSLTASANACACQGSANTGPPSSRGSCGSTASACASGMRSEVLKVVVPHVEIYHVAGRRPLSPQLLRGKSHRIEMLRVLPQQMSGGVREQEHAAILNDDARLSTRGAREARRA